MIHYRVLKVVTCRDDTYFLVQRNGRLRRLFGMWETAIGFTQDYAYDMQYKTEEEAKKAVVEVLINLLKPVPSLLRFGRGSNIAGCALSYRSMQPLVSAE